MSCPRLEKAEFELLEPHHYPVLEPFFKVQPFSLSTFCLSSVFAWRDEGDLHTYFAICEDVLLLMAEDPADPSQRYMALPIPALLFDPSSLENLMKNLGFDHLDYVPQEYLDHFGYGQVAKHFGITEQPELEDYIYHTEDLAELKGRKYAKKRNLISQFERLYAETGRCAVERIGAATDEHVSFVERWCEQNDCEDAESPLACDKRSAIDQLQHFGLYELSGLSVRIDEEIAGVAIASRLNDEMGVLTVEKALSDYKGLYQFLDREAARQLFSGKYKYLNKESDMGVPGLALSKRSYAPIRREGCFKLALKKSPKNT